MRPPGPTSLSEPESRHQHGKQSPFARGVMAVLSLGAALLRTAADPFVTATPASTVHAEPAHTAGAGGPGGVTEVAALIYELLDAHDDTALLAAGLETN